MANRRKTKSEPLLDLTGVWYNPEQSGFGILVNTYQGSNVQSVAIYSYDSNGSQVWMIGNAPLGESVFELYKPTATGFLNTISGFKTGERVGTISFEYGGEPGKLAYVATIRTPAVIPLDFSPSPDFTEFAGEVVRIG